MLSLGAVMLDADYNEVGEFQNNLHSLGWPAHPNHETMKWWDSEPAAWLRATENAELPGVVMHNFRHWVESFEGRVTVIGYPVTFDFNFVWWYLWTFTGGAPFAHGAMDIKTLAAARLGVPYDEARKSNWPKTWFFGDTHTHVAVEDAREQADSFRQIMFELKARSTALDLLAAEAYRLMH